MLCDQCPQPPLTAEQQAVVPLALGNTEFSKEMLTGLQDMKDHKTEFKNLSETAGHIILQNTRPLCVTTGDVMCIFPETQLLLL